MCVCLFNVFGLLAPLIKEKVMSGKLLIQWKHNTIKQVAMKRYMSNQETIKNTHAELANMFFSEFCEETSDDSEGEPGKSETNQTRIELINLFQFLNAHHCTKYENTIQIYVASPTINQLVN